MNSFDGPDSDIHGTVIAEGELGLETSHHGSPDFAGLLVLPSGEIRKLTKETDEGHKYIFSYSLPHAIPKVLFFRIQPIPTCIIRRGLRPTFRLFRFRIHLIRKYGLISS